MENVFSQSRTIINNKIYEKYRDQRYKNHKNTVQKLRCSESCYHQRVSPKYLKNISKSKKANSIINKVFDSSLIENKSLVRRLVDIEMKENKIQNFLSLYRMNSQKKNEEQQKIKHENEILKQKIKTQKKKILSIKSLKKQFKEHDRNVEHARKIKPEKKH